MRYLNEVLQALKVRRLHIDCFQMELVRNAEAPAERYTGRGYIDQDDEGRITFRMYTATSENISVIERLNELGTNKAGTVYGDSDYFTLRAIDYSGAEWTAERLLLTGEIWPRPPESLPYLSGPIQILSRSQRTYSDPSFSLSMHFFDEVDLPFADMSQTDAMSEGSRLKKLSRDNVEFESTSYRFTVTKSENGFKVDIISNLPFPLDFEMRVVEALRFATAHPLNWRVMVAQNAGREVWHLSSERKKTRATALPRPLLCKLPEEFSAFWRLFCKYLEYTAENSSNNEWNELSMHLSRTLEASANELDAWAVMLCIAVEGCAQLIKWAQAANDKTQHKALHCHIQAYLKNTGLQGTDFEARVLGVINSLATPRVQDKLLPLIAGGWVDTEHVTVWKRLRNSRAHGSVTRLSTLDTEKCNALLLKIYKTSMLMYHICFYLIEYKGPYTNYGMPGWPTASYPLPRPTAAQ